MSVKGLKSIFRIGDDITTSEIDTKTNTITFHTGDVASKTPGWEAESWQHVGFASRPSSISGTGDSALAAQALVIPRSDYDIVFATRDTRFQDIYGALKPGETCLYGTGADGTAQGRLLIKDNGSINLFTSKGNVKGGDGMGVFIDPAGSITLAAPSKAALILNDDGAKLFNAAGAIQIADSVLKISSTAKVAISGPSIVLGGPAATPVVNLPEMTQLLAIIATMQAEIVALQACLVGISALPVVLGPLVLPLTTTSAAVVTAGTTAVAAGAVAIPAAMMLHRVSTD